MSQKRFRKRTTRRSAVPASGHQDDRLLAEVKEIGGAMQHMPESERIPFAMAAATDDLLFSINDHDGDNPYSTALLALALAIVGGRVTLDNSGLAALMNRTRVVTVGEELRRRGLAQICAYPTSLLEDSDVGRMQFSVNPSPADEEGLSRAAQRILVTERQNYLLRKSDVPASD